MLVNKKYWGSSETDEQKDSLKIQDGNKHTESKRITSVLPRRPVVAAQDSVVEKCSTA